MNTEPYILVVSGSPVAGSRTLGLCQYVGRWLIAEGFSVESLDIRSLPAADMFAGRSEGGAIRAAVGLVEHAAGVVLVTPIYKAAYSGALKTFLDVLPQFAFAQKVVLPLAIGGSLAHVLAIDYSLRPVLAAMGGPHVVQGLFILESLLVRDLAGALEISTETSGRLDMALEELTLAVGRSSLKSGAVRRQA